jgi:hypothetical protein
LSGPDPRAGADWGDALLRTWGRAPELAAVGSSIALVTLLVLGLAAAADSVARLIDGRGQFGVVPLAAVLGVGGAVLSARILVAALRDLRDAPVRADGRVERCERTMMRGRVRCQVVVALSTGRRLGFEVEESLFVRAEKAQEVTITYTPRLQYLRTLERRVVS